MSTGSTSDTVTGLRIDRALAAQLALCIGGQRGHRPACIEALCIDTPFVGQEGAAERRMRPARTQRDPGVIAHRHHRQHAAAIQAQLQFNGAGGQRAALIRGETAHRRMQATSDFAGHAYAGSNRSCLPSTRRFGVPTRRATSETPSAT